MQGMPSAFSLSILPVELRFGVGQRFALVETLAEIAALKPLVVGTASARERYGDVISAIEKLQPVEFFEAEPHCPIEVVERCRQVYRDSAADSVVAIGGGSTLGLGKILSAEEGAKFVALPTTYSGSEMTQIFGRKIGDEKRVGRDPACRPLRIIYDPELTRDLPGAVAATSGMNSIAHAVEALYPQKPNALSYLLAPEALRALRLGLIDVTRGSRSQEQLEAALYGGFLGGFLVSISGIALHHQLCHVIGGLFDLPHGATNAVVLPHALAYNAPAVPDACRAILEIFGGASAASGLFEFAREIGAPGSLRELGMPAAGIEAVVDGMLRHGGWNPRTVERDGILTLIENAFEGRAPA
jgi:maleylacetate reductase